MYGDIVCVERKPLLWRSVKKRSNPNSGRMDVAIYRMMRYSHYGIDLGNGKVAHFQADSFWVRRESVIVEADIETFLKDGTLKVVYDIPYKFSRKDVVERAKAAMGTDFGGYSILFNNCEHFAMWCVTGVRESRQSFVIRYGTKAVNYPIKVYKKVLSQVG